jgi:hypothetical protein
MMENTQVYYICADPGGHAVYDVVLQPLDCYDCGLESR